jgi:hypothetical protein
MQEHTSDTERESYSVTEKKEKLKSYLNDMREREREREREACFTNVLCNIGIAGWG